MSMSLERRSTSIYFGTGRVLSIGKLLETGIHKLAVIRCLVSLKEPFQISLGDENWQETHAILINAGTTHALRNLNGSFVSITLVPERRRGKQLRESLLLEQSTYDLSNHNYSDYQSRFLNCLRKQCNCQEAFQVAVNFLDTLLKVNESSHRPDHRISQITKYIQENLCESLSANTLARLVFLSEDRFLHLFKEQLGLPLRQFILYQRMLFATREFLGGKSLTEAAHIAGFSDSAHFSRTFYDMNGIQPSKMARVSKNFKLFFCEHLSWL